MKLRPLKPHVFSAILIVSAVCIISFCARGAEAGPAKVRRNHKNPVASGSPETLMVGGTNTRQEILVDVGETVYISCHLNKTIVRGCEWFKKNPSSNTRKRITQFFDRYQTITPCQLQIRRVTYEDAGTIICRANHPDSESTIHTSQLTVTGHDDPYENVLQKQKSESTKAALPYSEPEILKETDVHEGHIGENILLKCEANGNPRPLVSWKRGSQNYTHPTEGFSILKINNVTQDDAGGYKCEAINIFGRVIQDVTVKVRGPLQGSSEIIDIAPRNVTLYEGNQGNLTCIARFEGDPWFGWVKRIENKTEEVNAFHYEGHYYSVLPRTDIRPLGQKLFATTLLLQNVTLANSGVYHCIVAGLQGYNHSGAFVTVEKDPSKLHMAQIRRHKTVAILWIFSFLIFAALVILCIVRIYGCPSANKTKKSTQGMTSSTTSSIMKTQLPKRSPETLSTDCTHPRHEVFAPLVTHGSCSLTSQEPSVMFKDCNSSCRTFNSYDPEFSLPSSADSFIIADLEAARSSYSHAESCDSKVCSKQSVTSPRTQTSDYYKRGQARKQRYHDRRGHHYHRHRHQHHHLYHPTASESQQSRYYDIQALNPHPGTPECCSYYAHNQSNLSISSDSESQWNSEPDNLAPEEDQSYFLEDEHPHYNGRRKLNPSPNLSFLEQLKANPNTVTAIL